MEFTLSAEQQTLADTVSRYLQQHHAFEDRHNRRSASVDRMRWRYFAEMGWLGAGLSEEEGGFGGGPAETAVIAEQFGKALVLDPFLSTAVLSIRTLLASGRASSRLIEDAVSGEKRIALACNEPNSGGDPSFVKTRAAARVDGFVLNGRKSLVLGATDADVVLVTARTDLPTGGVSLFSVPADQPGLSRQDYLLLDGRSVSDITLDNLEIGRDHLVGEPGTALVAVEEGLDHACVALCAESVGLMEAALWKTRDYLRTREQFGLPLGGFQALQHRMADMLVEAELSRSMLYQALYGLQSPAEERSRRVSAAKVSVARAGLFVARDAIQLHGAIGMTEEYEIGHLYKRLFVNASLFGDIDYHGERFSRSI